MSTTRLPQYALMLLCALIIILITSSPISNANSDPAGCLLVTQSILKYHTIKLDVYESLVSSYHGNIQYNGKNYYYYFPLGTSIYALPFVLIFNLFGMDMSSSYDDMVLQTILSALTVCLSCIITYRLFHLYVNWQMAFLLTIPLIFGSALISTMGTALWSSNLATFFAFVSLYLICKDAQGYAINALVLGVSMFSAYLCRPTTLMGIIAMFIYLILKNRKVLLTVSLVLLVSSVSFVIFSLLEYGTLVPDYYSFQRVARTDTFWVALFGNFLSPSRGLFIFSPYLGLVVIGTLSYIRRLALYPPFWVTVVWIVGHTFVISRFPHWWGGWSFGSRLFTDVYPALALLTVLVAKEYNQANIIRMRTTVAVLFLILTIISVFINTRQGLYNVDTYYWNNSPNVDEYPGRVFDWDNPQFYPKNYTK